MGGPQNNGGHTIGEAAEGSCIMRVGGGLQPPGSSVGEKHLATEQRGHSSPPPLCQSRTERKESGDSGSGRGGDIKKFCVAERGGDAALIVAAHFNERGTRKHKSLAFRLFFFMAACANKGDFNGFKGGGQSNTESAEFLIHAACVKCKMREFGCGDATVFWGIGGARMFGSRRKYWVRPVAMSHLAEEQLLK